MVLVIGRVIFFFSEFAIDNKHARFSFSPENKLICAPECYPHSIEALGVSPFFNCKTFGFDISMRSWPYFPMPENAFRKKTSHVIGCVNLRTVSSTHLGFSPRYLSASQFYLGEVETGRKCFYEIKILRFPWKFSTSGNCHPLHPLNLDLLLLQYFEQLKMNVFPFCVVLW